MRFWHGSGYYGPWRRSFRVIGEPFEVLDDGGQQELVPGAAETAQSQAGHREDYLGLAEQPFDFLALASRLRVSLGFHQGLGIVTSFLIDVP